MCDNLFTYILLVMQDDIKCIETEPSEQLLMSILSGYSPQAMNKALQYGMQFWLYQMEQEMMFSQHQLKEYHAKQKESDAQIESIHKTNSALIQQYEDQCQKLSDLLKQERAQKSLLEDQLKQFERDRARNSYDSFNNQWQSGGKSKGFNFSNVTPKTPFLKYQSHSMNDLSIDPPKFD
ncbi:hypothetical protein MP228_004435 [Amoeboaphelidium protococcarum]|nr:hypothetical protein MP228_004435 [Amoeboaphelidium protococcarum]